MPSAASRPECCFNSGEALPGFFAIVLNPHANCANSKINAGGLLATKNAVSQSFSREVPDENNPTPKASL